MSGHGWIGRAFRAFISPEPLPRDSCLLACGLVGALVGLAAGAALFMAPPSPGWPQLAVRPLSFAVAIMGGAALGWLWPPATRPYLVLAGALLVVTVVWYPLFMTGALAARSQSGIRRFGHAPGVLAFGLAFGLRLLLDFGVADGEARRDAARKLGIAGLAIGGCLDAFVVYRMIQSF